VSFFFQKKKQKALFRFTEGQAFEADRIRYSFIHCLYFDLFLKTRRRIRNFLIPQTTGPLSRIMGYLFRTPSVFGISFQEEKEYH
jgi:hypothetical protein